MLSLDARSPNPLHSAWTLWASRSRCATSQRESMSSSRTVAKRSMHRRSLRAVLYGTPIGTLGGLIGLGGAEFRLPVLKAAFGYQTHQAVALNLAVSLLTLLGALVIRVRVAPTAPLVPLVPVLVASSPARSSAPTGAPPTPARLSVERLERLILVLLVAIGLSLGVEAFASWQSPASQAACPCGYRSPSRSDWRSASSARCSASPAGN